LVTLQLEETVARLQAAMSLNTDQSSHLPSSQTRVKELERENQRLRSEIEDLRRQLAESPQSTSIRGLLESPRSISSEEPRASRRGGITSSPARHAHSTLPALDLGGSGSKRKRSMHEDVQTAGPSRVSLHLFRLVTRAPLMN